MLVFGQSAVAALPKIRDWVNEHSWIAGEAATLIVVVIVVADLLK